MVGNPSHVVGGALVRTEEELRAKEYLVSQVHCEGEATGTHNLLLAVEVDDLVLDARCAAGKEQVEDRVDELAEASLRVGAEVGEDGALRATFGDVLVLRDA